MRESLSRHRATTDMINMPLGGGRATAQPVPVISEDERPSLIDRPPDSQRYEARECCPTTPMKHLKQKDKHELHKKDKKHKKDNYKRKSKDFR